MWCWAGASTMVSSLLSLAGDTPRCSQCQSRLIVSRLDRQLDHSRMRGHESLCPGVPIHQLVCHPETWVVTRDDRGRAPDTPGRPGGPDLQGPTPGHYQMRWTDMNSPEPPPRYRSLLCFNDHFTDPALFVISTDTRHQRLLWCHLGDSTDLHFKLIKFIVSEMNSKQKLCNKETLKLLQHLGRVTRVTRQGNQNKRENKMSRNIWHCWCLISPVMHCEESSSRTGGRCGDSIIKLISKYTNVELSWKLTSTTNVVYTFPLTW